MTGADLLLDTNAAIAITKRDVMAMGLVMSFDAPALSLFTVGEMQFGVQKSARSAENLAAFMNLRRRMELLLPDQETAGVYGQARYALHRKGRPIPENDLWIAALALQHDLPLMTRDAHFSNFEKLRIAAW